ncbi:MAG: methyltransferase domain-containing protein [Chloroflexi bacterium]|nr:methyltransferase domain-containing protein [Chloroflexota bacterium]
MVNSGSSTPDYTMGFSDEFMEIYRRYTAETSAAYLLPHLRPGLRVLDFGCGPGAISVGLAKAVDPGELHGVDMEESQIDLARRVAKTAAQANAFFHVGDVTALDFEDNSFDLAHCHNVLMHVPDTRAVLDEVKRVLKPGGLLACREMISASSFTHPDYGVIRKAWDMFEDLLMADDAHPQMGKDMKGHLMEAGFENLRMTASFDIYSTPKDRDFIYGLALQWFLSPEITEAAIKYGASSQELCDEIATAYMRWKEEPGAFCAVAFGEVIANKP